MTRLAALLVALAVISCGKKRIEGEDPDARKLPLINLPWVGPERYAPSMLQGRVVLVHFTATWCLPCLTDLETLEAMQKKHGAEGFQVIAIGMDLEGKKVLEPFAYHYRLPFPVLVADDRFRRGETRFGVISALPAYVLYNREGEAIAAWAGPANAPQLDEAISDAVR